MKPQPPPPPPEQNRPRLIPEVPLFIWLVLLYTSEMALIGVPVVFTTWIEKVVPYDAIAASYCVLFVYTGFALCFFCYCIIGVRRAWFEPEDKTDFPDKWRDIAISVAFISMILVWPISCIGGPFFGVPLFLLIFPHALYFMVLLNVSWHYRREHFGEDRRY